MTTDASTARGHAVYSPFVLRAYDLLVHGFSNRCAWKCPTATLRELFQQHLTGNHLDVGVGTGYFLDRVPFPTSSPRLVLLDANPHCLASTAGRLARYRPECWQADLLQPLALGSREPFDSVSLNYVLHCLPGRMEDKGIVLDHLQPLMKPEGVLFGATLLGQGTSQNWLARRLMSAYNRRGIFGNRDDTLDALQTIFASRFADVRITVHGCAALFVARA